MCDYSLFGIPNRLAIEGEQLVVHRFSTGAMGLACPADLQVRELSHRKKTFWQALKSLFTESGRPAAVPAVCIPPGAHLLVSGIPANVRQRCRVSDEEEVVFTQITAEINTHRDAIRFQNGNQLRLQDLQEGMCVQVLTLSGVQESTRPASTVGGSVSVS